MPHPRKTLVPTAVNSRTNIPLTPQHVTTADFMQFNVSLAIELAAESSIEVSHTLFTRLEPLAVPTFGRAMIKNKAFFVPFRTVFPAWNDFINDVPHVYDNGVPNLVSTVPTFSYSAIWALFMNPDCSTQVQTADLGADFSNRRFTDFGRWCYKILISLGYKFPLALNSEYVDTYSAMPLLCLGRVFCDWFYPPQYANDTESAWLLSLFTNNTLGFTPFTSSNGALLRLLKIIYRLAYSPDYFTSAWDNPNGPNTGLNSTITIPDINGDDFESGSIASVSNNAFGSNNTAGATSVDNGGVGTISQYLLTALRSLTDYMKRHQIAGARSLDRYLSRWGVRLSSEKLNRSVFVHGYEQPIQFGDVVSTADTEGSPLGSFAGKGMSYRDNSPFVIDSNGEFGFAFIITTIVPEIEYYQGINRHARHLSKLDFFTPEFDNLGVQALSSTEVYIPLGKSGDDFLTHSGSLGSYAQQVFGFVPRYAEYKVPFSILSGDYVCDSVNTGKDSWTLFRDLSHLFTGSNDVVHSYDFITSSDASQFKRIFYRSDANDETLDDADHFNIIHDFNIRLSFPGKSLYDTYEFKDEDKSRKESMDINGTVMN